jgi:hypothetical protein
MRTIRAALIAAIPLHAASSALSQNAQPQITVPEIMAVEFPRAVSQIGPADTPRNPPYEIAERWRLTQRDRFR